MASLPRLAMVVAALAVALQASAAEIRVMTSGGFTAAYQELTPGFERATGHKVLSAYGASQGGAPDSIPSRLSTELFPKMGIWEEIKAKSKRIESERVGTVVARGDAEIGFQQVSELLPIPGVDYVGPLPEGAQRVTTFSAGIASGAREAEAARELVRYFASPEAVAAIRKSGLEPAKP